MPRYSTFNERLRHAMQLRGKSISDVAAALDGGSDDLVFSWVKEGSTRFPIIKTRKALAEYLAVDYVWLAYGGGAAPGHIEPSPGQTVIQMRDALRNHIAKSCGCSLDDVEIGITIKRLPTESGNSAGVR